MKKTKEEKLEMRRHNHEKTLHHRKPTSIGGRRHDPKNHSWLHRNKHQAWHTLFENYGAQAICGLINRDYLDTDYVFICVRKEALCKDSS